MLARISVVALNTYREAVRARVLHGLFALAIATAGYSLVVGAFALNSSLRVVSDLGAASISIYGIVVAVVLGATSLYRELELKTIFPILARPIRRWEYLLGKYLGTVLTLAVFIAANSGVLLLALGIEAGRPAAAPLGIALGRDAGGGALLAFRLARVRTYLPIPWAFLILDRGCVLRRWRARRSPRGARLGHADAFGGGARDRHCHAIFFVFFAVFERGLHLWLIRRGPHCGHVGSFAGAHFRYVLGQRGHLSSQARAKLDVVRCRRARS